MSLVAFIIMFIISALQFLYGEEVDVPTVSRHLPADVLGGNFLCVTDLLTKYLEIISRNVDVHSKM